MQRRRVVGRLIVGAVLLGATLTAHAATITYSNAPSNSVVGTVGSKTDGAFGETFNLTSAAGLDSLWFYAGGPVSEDQCHCRRVSG